MTGLNIAQKIRVAGIVNDSITDGVGLRYVVFTQGCPHHCNGCHNPQTHDFNGGYEIELGELMKAVDENPLLYGVTLSGGEPIMQAGKLIDFAKFVKSKNLNLALYTGFTFEELLKRNDKDINELLNYVDVMIDGKFELDKRSLDLKFKGSSNQRTINVKESLKKGEVVLMTDESWI